VDLTQEVDALLKAAVKAGDVPGIAAIALDGDGMLYEGAFGRRNTKAGEDMARDTVFWYASMTKAIVTAALMQIVEQGKVRLDDPVGAIMPDLAAPLVLEGFANDGTPRLRPAKGAITARHLLTHTAGFGHEIWNADVGRYMRSHDLPSMGASRRKSLFQPLVADPGTEWVYGIGIDWAGQLVEAVSGQSLRDYLREHIFAPLGMRDTDFIIGPSQRRRLARVHRRNADGSWETTDDEISQEPEFYMGGGGLYGSGRDYAALLQMFLRRGLAGDGGRILRAETIALMARNNIGDIAAGGLRTVMPHLSHDLAFFPGMTAKWGLSFLINPEPLPGRRSAGSLAWGGLANTYYWIDLESRVAGVILTQILPFADPIVLRLYEAFERAVYASRV
jgi:CubicO group peptidase (beta-lactamase class C family)